MPKMLHLVDKVALDGVTRTLASVLPRLQGRCEHELRQLTANDDLQAGTPVDAVCVHFTVSWANLAHLIALRHRFAGRLILFEYTYSAAYERLCTPYRRQLRTMLQFAYGLFDMVVAVSPAQQAWMVKAELVPPHRLRLIVPSVDLSRLLALPFPARHAGPLRLGAYGPLVPQQGFDRLVEAMRLVSPDVATQRIAGFGPEAIALRRMAEKLPHVQLEEAVADPQYFLSEVDAIAIPSRWEPMGLVALESRAAARPLIVAGIDGLAEQVSPAFGLVVNADSAIDLADGIDRMAAADLPAMAAAARASVTGDVERDLTQWQGLIEEIIGAEPLLRAS
ncbi:MAG: glycosyltransferase family 4 protein [Alphaproteobacteria bacterium]|nr:glycosyltransferase family 4 protein [Alphaproteobacteria bacterium]